MASNTFTIEICDEDRRRIDALVKALSDSEEINRIIDEVKYVRSQAYWPHMGEFSRGHETACDEILARINKGKPNDIKAGRITLESVAKRLSEVEQWVDRRESHESEQREYGPE